MCPVRGEEDMISVDFMIGCTLLWPVRGYEVLIMGYYGILWNNMRYYGKLWDVPLHFEGLLLWPVWGDEGLIMGCYGII